MLQAAIQLAKQQQQACHLQGDPPVTRNQPPVAGAIKWERSLFQRVKQTKQKLDTVEKELMADEGGQQVGALPAA